jgi:hypothetical protein
LGTGSANNDRKPGKKKKRPIDTPTQENRIAQEAIRGILEAIYEPEFSAFEKQSQSPKGYYYCTNYGFRPNKSTWLAANTLKLLGRGTTHAIEGDIVGAYNNVNHEVLLAILGRRIKDKAFLSTMEQLLKSGIMYKDKFINSTVGTPQGGIVSPLLFNIYMFELDKFIYENYYLPSVTEEKKKVNNPAYKRLEYQMQKLLTSYKQSYNLNERKILRKEFKALQAQRFKLPSRIPESLPRSIVYSRYADDWVLLVTGPETHALKVKTEITTFLRNTLKMELDTDKTKITRLEDGFGFLGFHLKRWGPDQQKFDYTLTKTQPVRRYLGRATSRQITIYPDTSRIEANLLRNKFCITKDLIPISRNAWALLDEFEIVLKYQQIFRGLANYYRYCDGYHVLNRASYILQYSCAKTLSYRQKSSVSKIFKKYGKNMTIRREIYNSKGSVLRQVFFITHTEIRKIFADLTNKNKKKKQNQSYNPPFDSTYDPFRIITYWRTKFKLYTHCCICGYDEGISLHHCNSLRALKSLKTKDPYAYVRSCLDRMQIPVCHSCHVDITNGVYSDKSPMEFYDEFIARL